MTTEKERKNIPCQVLSIFFTFFFVLETMSQLLVTKGKEN